jgi:signal transduction histidine kinase
LNQESRARIPVPVRIRVEDEKGFEKTVVFRQGVLRVGSDPESGLRLQHQNVAPCHLLILREGEKFTFADTSAGMATVVNGTPTLKGELNHADVITFGPDCPYRLTFLVDTLRSGDRRERKLQALLAASRAINASLVLEEVLERVMDSALRVTGAEKGFLIMIENDGSLKPCVSRKIDSDHLKGEMLPSSLSMIRKAIAAKRSVHHVAGDPEGMTGAGAASIVRLKLNTVICTPILAHGEAIGVIYVDHGGILQGAASEDMEIMEALADQASVAIENARLSRQMMLTERLSAVGRMVSSIVHDLNGPLTGIMAALQLIKREPGGRKTGDLLDLIGDEAERMTEMTRDVLEYCRGRMQMKPEPVSLRVFLGRLIQAVHNEMTARSIRVLVGLREDLVIQVDVKRLERAFRNLFGNAADAMSHGGEIHVSAARAQDRIMISITDSGCGMSEEVRRRALEPFYTAGKESGTGLGMAIAARIVEGHGGAMEIESTEGSGTTVRILLPLRESGGPGDSDAIAVGVTTQRVGAS